MSLDAAQDASAIAELVHIGMKVTSYIVVALISGAGTDCFKSHFNKEKRMRFTVSQCREILSHMNEEQVQRMGQRHLEHFNDALNNVDQRLRLLAIEMQNSSLWERTWGRCAESMLRVESLVRRVEQDLRVTTENILGDVPLLELGPQAQMTSSPTTSARYARIMEAVPALAHPEPPYLPPGRVFDTAEPIGQACVVEGRHLDDDMV
ncbi:hypothetical protein BC628DRAFT_1360214 [Trametes gibbosa]|nr:hypothetical protein BC628DRAFT_1360214 [Trametes gibbosa]